MDNATRRQLLQKHKMSGFPGSIMDVFQAHEQGVDLIDQFQQQQMQVAKTPQERQQGLRPAHQSGNTNASMAFPNTPPNASFNTMGMKSPIDVKQFDDTGNLVKSYDAVPPGVTDLKMSSKGGTVIETPSQMQSGGFAAAESTRTQTPVDPRIISEAEATSSVLNQARIQSEIETLGYPFSYSGRATPTDSPVDYALGFGPSAARGLTRGALKNAYKLNPFANKLNDPNAFYRITGRDAFEDAMATGVVRNNPISPQVYTGPVTLDKAMLARSTPFPSFAKGSPDLHYMKNADDVIFQNSGPMYKRGEVLPSGKTIRGRHWAYRPYDEATQKVASEVPVEKVYEATPNWLMGHKRIYRDGGTKEYQQGGAVPTLYVDDPNHPRIQQYADSLQAYNFGVQGKAMSESSVQKALAEYNNRNNFTRTNNAFPQTSSVNTNTSKTILGLQPSSSYKTTFMAPAPHDPNINMPVQLPIPGGQNQLLSSSEYSLWDKPKQPVVYRAPFQKMNPLPPANIQSPREKAALQPVMGNTQMRRKPTPIYQQDQGVSTGQYQIGENLWDPNKRQWRRDVWDKETQQEFRNQAVPRGQYLKASFKKGGIRK